MLLRMIYAIPLLGWMLRDAVQGTDESRVWFMLNMIMLWIFAGVIFGYPGIIIPAIAAAFMVLTTLVWMTAGSLFPRR
ncbi:hypothetical protein [Microbaculum marinisediminis]|uniref:Uncharacterized protein n=1 Tax=Microbaculum marinisediminis TaxID=2931392 RepID=A0AAW5QWW1_9HYPH|nr:hypothetical protein [Microbaculum sp. A6E488]MCT8972551.1 hypothetical protein [Microbaculum sp. A6E488]